MLLTRHPRGWILVKSPAIGQVRAMAVINLNKARKARAREAERAQADANRRAFGRTKAEKARDKIERDRADKVLDGAEISAPEPSGR
jgi:phage protein D